MTNFPGGNRLYERLKSVGRRLVPLRWHLSYLGPRYLRRQIAARTRMRVSTGPFEGMRYVDASWGSVWEPKLLGIYERELHRVVAEAVSRRPSRIVDVGAAEGYYAVGLARAVRSADVYAFEADADAHPLLRTMAELNGVSARMHVGGLCTPERLADVVGDGRGVLVVCDVEGAEVDLLDPDRIAGLRHASVLVELHAGRMPNVGQTLRDRFSPTHDVTPVLQEARSAREYPYPARFVPEAYRLNAVSEHRQPWEPWMQWYWMVPRPGPMTGLVP